MPKRTPRPDLRMRRLAMGLTLKALAKQVECDRSTLGKIENGRLAPTPNVARRLAIAFRVDVHSVLAMPGNLKSVPPIHLYKWAAQGHPEKSVPSIQRYKNPHPRCRALRQLRRDRGLSLGALGRLANVSPGMLSHLECGRRRPTTRIVRRLREALDLRRDQIFPEYFPPQIPCEFLRQQMVVRGVNGRELGRDTDIGQIFISKFCRGAAVPWRFARQKLCAYFNLSEIELFPELAAAGLLNPQQTDG